jgi:ADP-ribose pyrophosphatase YjhB (NUDIX family)
VTSTPPTPTALGPTGTHLKYCPKCAAPLEWRPNGGRDRPHCTAESCGYIFFGDFSIGVGGVVIRDRVVADGAGSVKEALLVQRGWNPGKGSWQIPGGYVEVDEDVTEGVERECLEEAGVRAKVVDVLGFRHAIGGGVGGPSTNIYVVFRLEPEVGDEPHCDGDEISDVGYFTLEEIDQKLRAQSLSRWAIQRALHCGQGLVQAHKSTDISRPGWALFGLPLPEGLEQVSVAPGRVNTPPAEGAQAVPASPPESLPPGTPGSVEGPKTG